MNKVNLFIVGAAKSATSSLHEYLSQHPKIFMSKTKELNFFTSDLIKNDKLYYNGNTLTETIFQYESNFNFNNEISYYGESSVSYLFYKNTSAKIRNYNNQSKIIILLRNPINRAISHYQMDYNAGYFNYSLDQIVNLKPKLPYQQIIENSMYYSQIQEYISQFGLDNVKIILFEKFIGNEKFYLKKIEKFLNLENFNHYQIKKINSYFNPKNRLLKHLNRNVRIKSFLKFFIPKNNILKIKSKITVDERLRVDSNTTQSLFNIFHKDVLKLDKLLNSNFYDEWFKS